MAKFTKPKRHYILRDVEGTIIEDFDSTRASKFVGIWSIPSSPDEYDHPQIVTKWSSTRKGASAQAYLGQANEVVEIIDGVAKSTRYVVAGEPNAFTTLIREV